MGGPQFQFEWEVKADANVRKHGVAFELARTIFNDRRLLTVADLEHSETEELWFSIGRASSGVMLSVVYLWSEATKRRERHAGRNRLQQRCSRSSPHPSCLQGPDARFIERSVWEYFSGKAEQRGVDLSDLLSEVLKRDIETNEALK